MLLPNPFLRARLLCGCLLPALWLCSFSAEAQVQWNLVWSDEFNGPTNTAPDGSKWAYDTPTAGTNNNELETYCGQTGAGRLNDCSNWLQNAHLDGQGNLLIAAILHTNGHWTSARIYTHTKFTFTYGRVEARMKLPVGAGLWPACWMLGDNIFSGTSWPACGEQDLMENAPSLGASKIQSSLHGPNYNGNNSLHSIYTLPSGGRIDDAYHIYGVIWTTNSVQFYVDDYTKPFVAFNPGSMPAGGTWAFNNHPFFILLNLAVGGSWPGNPNSSTPNPAIASIDYVRVYQRGRSPGIYEAENAVVKGAIITNTAAGFAGTGYVDYQNASGDYVEWTVNTPFASTVPLTFRYANGTSLNQPLELKVNNVVVNRSLNFLPTGNFNTWTTVSNAARLNAGTNTVRLTTIGSNGANFDYLLVGAGANAPPGLALRFPFADLRGATTTDSDPNAGGANLALQMLSSNNVPTDYHGQDGSGLLQLGRALDFSSDPDGLPSTINLNGGIARAINQPNLGFETVTSFTATVWFKLDSLVPTNANRGGRVFVLGTNGISDQGSSNCLSLHFFNNTQLQYKINSNTVAVISTASLPSDTWLYHAIVYDGAAATVYSGSETSPAALFANTNNLPGPQSLNFGTSGTFLVGNRFAMDRALDGWIQDFRFYTYAGNPNLIEQIRWSVLAPAGLTALPDRNAVRLTWNAMAGAAGYDIYRSTTNGSGYTLLARSVPGTSYTDTTVSSGSTYYYVISAVDANGGGANSQTSAETSITAPPPGLGLTATATNLAFSWPSSALGFKLYTTASLAPPVIWSLVLSVPLSQGGSFTVNLTPDTTNRFFRLSSP